MTDRTGTLRPPGLGGRVNRHISRNKIACVVSAMLAVIFVALFGLLALWFLTVIHMIENGDAMSTIGYAMDDTPFGEGVLFAIVGSFYNWLFFFIVMPVTWLVISQTVGRLAHRGISDKWTYVRVMAIVGAVLVGGTCSLPAWFELMDVRDLSFSKANSILDILSVLAGGLLTGGLIGALAGSVVGAIFVMIVRPASQLAFQDTSTADVF